MEKKDYVVDSTTQLLNEASNYRQLSAEEEKELIVKAQNGDIEARNILVETNLLFIASIARKKIRKNLELNDLIQDGVEGFIKGIEKFDLSRNVRLRTYAEYWARQYIERSINDSRTIRISPVLQQLIRDINDIVNKYMVVNNCQPSLQIIAEELGVSVDRIKVALMLSQETCSCDTNVYEDSDETLLDLIKDDKSPLPDDIAIKHSLRELINMELENLSSNQKRVIELRYGLSGNHCHTLGEIGIIMGLSNQRVRQIEIRALYRLKYSKKIKELIVYIKDSDEIVEQKETYFNHSNQKLQCSSSNKNSINPNSISEESKYTSQECLILSLYLGIFDGNKYGVKDIMDLLFISTNDVLSVLIKYNFGEDEKTKKEIERSTTYYFKL